MPPRHRKVSTSVLEKQAGASELDHILDSTDTAPLPARIDGVMIGRFEGSDPEGRPLVSVPELPELSTTAARTTATLRDAQVGCELALMFEAGDPRAPIVMGVIQHPSQTPAGGAPSTEDRSVFSGRERFVFEADREIVLKAGKASITLTRAGKILLRGTYLLSRSSGVNHIKGGSVQLN
jgi:hypothetical protein